MPKIIILEEKCKGCEFCVITCPKKIIKLSQKLNKKGYHPAIFFNEDKCTACGFCYQICPEVAIEVWK